MKEPNNQNAKIAVVICYIGTLPWYFEYFIHTCKYNPTIDFLIISDDLTSKKTIPENVKIIHKTLSEMNKLATERLGFPVEIKNPYKLCDFKPTYGQLFSEYLTEYDFWGHGDIDVIFGNIRNFITNDILSSHDLISVRHDFLTGYFLLFRNNSKMNSLYMHSKDYRKVFQSEKHFCFDETNFQFDGFAQGKQFSEVPSEIESMMHVVKRLESTKYIRTFFDFLVVEGVPGHIKWKSGSLYYRKRYEILLYHLIHFKNKYSPKRAPGKIPEAFTITTRNIYHRNR